MGPPPDRFCPVCGAPLEPRDRDGVERLTCTKCGRVHYRNSKPTVGAVVLRGDQVLLARRARPPHEGWWDLPGGFLEAGEHPEAGLARELAEETGLRLGQARLLDIATGEYAGEPTLNLMYVCEAEGEPRPASDVAELQWFPLRDLPEELAWPHERAALRALAAGAP